MERQKQTLNEHIESVINIEDILDRQYDSLSKLYSSVETDDGIMESIPDSDEKAIIFQHADDTTLTLECTPDEWEKVILNETKPVKCNNVPLIIVNYNNETKPVKCNVPLIIVNYNNETKDFVCRRTKYLYGIFIDKCCVELHHYWLESLNVHFF
ncbi:unnamed protein product [Mytilus coruscus]|uniref:Uncharacterized protein n=1 Tax=Mytilus coruscus TaxID=42192 RepID=A0A6J8CAG3_MYTCO|nr:unnamed protein product [Mytilus coruscus]